LRILLADGQALYRAGLAQLLREMESGVELTEADDLGEAVRQLRGSNAFELVLVDLDLLESQGASWSELAAAAGQAPIVTLAQREQREDILKAVQAGARAFIPKSFAPRVVLSVLRLVLAGGIYVPPSVLWGQPRAELPLPLPVSTRRAELTGRQIDVLRRLAEGKTNREIAQALGLAEGTVKIHVTAIFKTLGVRNRTQAVLTSRRLLQDSDLTPTR